MNREMKRLIEVLNEAGYEVIEIGDIEYGNSTYHCSGTFCLKVADTSKDHPQKSQP